MKHVDCPFCGSKNQRTLYRDRRVDGNLRELPVIVVQCHGCGFLYNSTRPDRHTLAAYYSDDAMASGQVYRDESAAGHYTRLYAQRVAFLARLLSRRPAGKLFDVGCGNGGFLRAIAAEMPDWKLAGLDPSKRAVENCSSHGLSVIRGAIGDNILKRDRFDAIVLLSVLEHLPDPASALAWCRQRLADDGLLFLEVPDSLQPEVSLTGFFNLEHIVHFTPATLGLMLREQGFDGSLRDHEAKGVIRLIAGNDLNACGAAADATPADDRRQARQVILSYAMAERELINSLRKRVTDTIEEWQRRNLRIAVYGAGIHSAQLATLVDLRTAACCFLDGDPTKQGHEFLGLPVFAPERLVEEDINAVLISSNRFIGEMLCKICEIGGPDLEVQTCYE